MNDTNLKYFMNEYAMESFMDMRNAQESGKDKLEYFKYVMEGSVETNATLLQKLYTDILANSNIDFGDIPDSKGNITKYTGYNQMVEAIEMLNKLFEGVGCDEIKIMNSLHDMIVSCKKDYEYGYNFDIEIVKIMYCTSVVALYEMINVCILVYTKKMRQNAGVEIEIGKTKKKDILIIRNSKSLIKSYESGQWSKLINAIKKDPNMFVGATAVTEAKSEVGNIIADAWDSGKVILDKIPDSFKKVGLALAAVVAVFLAIRGLVYAFAYGAVKIKDYCNTQKEFVEFAVKQEKEDGEPDKVIKKHTKLAERLERIANFIEVKILHTNLKASKEIEKSNKENYPVSDFKSVSLGGNIEF